MTALGLTYPLLRRALFQLDAEEAHHLTLRLLWLLRRARLLRPLAWGMPAGSPVKVAGLTFPNVLGLGAGLDKEAACADAFCDMGFGFVEVGTLTPRPQPGNPSPRLFRLIPERAIVNRMGFNNPGVVEGMRHLSRQKVRGLVGVNLGKNFDTPNESASDDYETGFRAAAPHADYITVNLSSPNTKGLRDLQNEDYCRALILRLRRVRDELERKPPIFLKIAPDLSDEAIDSLADVFLETGLDGVIATNTTISRGGVADNPLSHETGGLSGAPLRSRATEVVARLRQRTGPNFPLMAAGGILSAKDAEEKIQAGAQLIQVYTGFIYRGPALLEEILRRASPP